MTTTSGPASPPPASGPGPDDGRRLHWTVTGLLAVAFAGYVLHEHPALRETAAALGGIGMLALAALLALRGR